MSDNPPSECLLCGRAGAVSSAGFSQRYAQRKDEAPLWIDWWECSECRGWFAFPVPSADAIQRNQERLGAMDPKRKACFAEMKQGITNRLLDGLRHHGENGNLLDVGCGFGSFMLVAQQAGWKVFGFEPNEQAVAVARQQGLEVYQGWELDKQGLGPEQFQAIVLNDVFYYSWHPRRDLETFLRLLSPGGTLAMRVSNKRAVLGWLRRSVPGGPKRNARLSRALQGQFHSISISSLKRISKEVGFDEVQIQPHAPMVPFSVMTWRTRAAYLISTIVRMLTFGQIDLSPGILIFARKGA